MHPRSPKFATAALLGSVVLVIVVGAALSPEPTSAGPRTPAPEDIVARVPARASDPAAREIDRLRRTIASAASPQDPSPALRLARLHVEEGRRRADPRHFGHAEAVLLPLCDGEAPVAEALVLRAVVHQARHRFTAALADLDRALALRPENVQALLVRASVLTVLGRHREAAANCEGIARHSTGFVTAACRAPLDGMRGRAKQAMEALTGALDTARGATERAWGASLLGELAQWNGDAATAEQRFREALALDPGDRYSRSAYADLLLDAGRAAEARALLVNAVEEEGSLVRLAIAERTLGISDLEARSRTLRARFEADRRRQEPVHAREEARFALSVDDDPVRALELALENWTLQREPWDARLVLEAALAARRPDAARPALAWLHETGFEDPRLRALAKRLEAMP